MFMFARSLVKSKFRRVALSHLLRAVPSHLESQQLTKEKQTLIRPPKQILRAPYLSSKPHQSSPLPVIDPIVLKYSRGAEPVLPSLVSYLVYIHSPSLSGGGSVG